MPADMSTRRNGNLNIIEMIPVEIVLDTILAELQWLGCYPFNIEAFPHFFRLGRMPGHLFAAPLPSSIQQSRPKLPTTRSGRRRPCPPPSQFKPFAPVDEHGNRPFACHERRGDDFHRSPRGPVVCP